MARQRCLACGVLVPQGDAFCAACTARRAGGYFVALPPIAPGELRCQQCAAGVDPRFRFCRPCYDDIRPKAEVGPRVGRKQNHPNALPEDHPDKIAWMAKVQATVARRGRQLFKPKQCRYRGGCDVVFQPTGPASKFCEAHR